MRREKMQRNGRCAIVTLPYKRPMCTAQFNRGIKAGRDAGAFKDHIRPIRRNLLRGGKGNGKAREGRARAARRKGWARRW